MHAAATGECSSQQRTNKSHFNHWQRDHM